MAEARLLSVRERMEQHRANPACTSCHRVIDPLGLALENFDVTGAWRIKDNGVPIDPSGTLYDGTAISGPVGLRQALMKRSDVVAHELHREPDDLRARPPSRALRHADRSHDRSATRTKNDHKMSSFILGVINSPAFQMSRAEAWKRRNAAVRRRSTGTRSIVREA